MADKQLQRVRPCFVDKVSKEVIKQLLDLLLHDGVLNDGEKEAVLEENDSRADKARCLLDKVKKKGNLASSKMIAHLKSVDAALFSELGLSNEEPAQPVPAGPVAQGGSTPPVSNVEEFWKSKKDDPKVYLVTRASFRNRVALLITNIKFSEEKMNRRGAEKDEENMENLLSTLGYEVVKHTDLTGKAIDEALTKFSKHPKLKQTDSVFVVIMSHGKLGKILGVDWQEDNPDEFPINNIFKHLGSGNCPELINKPKVIIIQACRGEQRGSVLVSDSPNTAGYVPQPEDFEADKLQFVHSEKDFISLLSCTPDTVSYRQPDQGSVLIQFIVKAFSPGSYLEHIYELFTKVMQHVEQFRYCEKLQMPTIDRCTLIKSFYLFQGLLDNNN